MGNRLNYYDGRRICTVLYVPMGSGNPGEPRRWEVGGGGPGRIQKGPGGVGCGAGCAQTVKTEATEAELALADKNEA
jgi:hypothetical protein